MGADEILVRLASSAAAAAGSFLLAAVAVRALRIRSPGLRGAVWTWAVADAALALADWNSAGLLLLRFAVPEGALVARLGGWAPALVAAWAAAAGVLVAVRFGRSLRAGRIARTLLVLHPAPFGGGRVALVPGDGAPFVAGVLAPVVVVPRAFWDRLDERGRAAVLAHEEAHASRRDVARRLAAWVVADALWFSLPLRAAVRRLDDAFECAADAEAVRRGASPGALARAVVEAALRGGPAPAGASALGGGPLRARLDALRRPARRRAVLVQAAVLVLLAPWRPGDGSAAVRTAPASGRGTVSVGFTWTVNPLLSRIAAVR